MSALHKCRSNCPWVKKQTVESFAQEFFEEAQEVIGALKKKDVSNLKEELGDAVWDALMVAHIAEEQGLFTVQEVVQGVIDKMKRRKPYAFEGRQVTLEEAGKLWIEVKEQEKAAKHS